MTKSSWFTIFYFNRKSEELRAKVYLAEDADKGYLISAPAKGVLRMVFVIGGFLFVILRFIIKLSTLWYV